MSAFEIPTQSRQELAMALHDCGVIQINESDLVNPSPQDVSCLFTAILTSLDFLKEDHGQLDFGALDRFDNPDLHQESIRVMELFCKMKEVLAAIGSPLKFTLDDLIRPDPNRILKHNIMNSLEEIYEEVSRLEDQQKEGETKISQLNAEIAEYNKACEEQLPLVHEAEAKVKQLRQTIPSLNNQQASLRNSLLKMKEKAKEMDEKISKAKFEVIQSEQEKSNLQSRIVQSPDKLQRALEEKKTMLLEAKNREKMLTERIQEKSSILEVYTKAHKKMSKNFSQMQALQEQVVSAKSIDKSLKQLKAKLEDDRLLDISLEANLVELQGRVKQLEENKRQLEKERDHRFENCQKEMNSLKLDLQSRRRALEGKKTEIESTMAEVDSINSKINSVKDCGAETQRALLQKAELVSNECFVAIAAQSLGAYC
ncbi:hypothetical protein V2J09_011272 [Rumex salicifolius]